MKNDKNPDRPEWEIEDLMKSYKKLTKLVYFNAMKITNDTDRMFGIMKKEFGLNSRILYGFD